MDVVRLDLGCDGESWHRSKPLQRCKLKITGLCKLCTYGCIMIGALITPGITQTRILSGQATIAILAFFLLDADSRIASEFS
jgi:hypothetical protein